MRVCSASYLLKAMKLY